MFLLVCLVLFVCLIVKFFLFIVFQYYLSFLLFCCVHVSSFFKMLNVCHFVFTESSINKVSKKKKVI